MKKCTIVMVLLLGFITLQAQDYEITFTGSGEINNVDSVYVKNLDQQTELTMNGSDILYLTETLGIINAESSLNEVAVYPNPMSNQARIRIHTAASGNMKLNIYSIAGKKVASMQKHLKGGGHTFRISGLPAGVYTLMASTQSSRHESKIVSLGSHRSNPSFTYSGSTGIPKKLTHPKGTVDMQYNDGERLLLRGYAEQYGRVKTFIPTESQTQDFHFIECMDYDDNSYPVVTIGEQIWMAKNLQTSHYMDGTEIPLVETNDAWDNLGYEQRAWCYYDNSDANGATYGVLYTWAAASDNTSSKSSHSDVQGACPGGWHLPSDAEWTELVDFLDGEDEAGGDLKETGTEHWYSLNEGATNSSGFTALPGGHRKSYGEFWTINSQVNYWTSTENTGNHSWMRSLDAYGTQVSRMADEKDHGFYVRCVKD
ncbi:MAG: T9SS type A sorting domain-containing protein [Bacteroidales bacterium]|nr:T9SS type A sorting domain-containing protein [Bacteroidales bacterium]MCF8336565.1 T9SS type A sorting domain-containing protein [Bacteroidales bacterium]